MSNDSRYKIEFHHEAARDLGAIPRNLAARILRAIESRLSERPEAYADRLRKSLHGYWKLRVGDYRIVFEVIGKSVRVHGIMHRRDVYLRIASRLARGWKPRFDS